MSGVAKREALTREQALEVLKAPRSADEPGDFLCFAMIPIEERIGEWRFAGVAHSVGQALIVLEDFHRALGWAPRTKGGSTVAELLSEEALAVLPDARKAWSTAELPLTGNRLVLLGEGQAPYDDVGLCIIELASLATSEWAGRAPDTRVPESWREHLDEEE